jgi:methyl-accepting chemotaxis protein
MMENQEKEKSIRWKYYIDKRFQNQFMIRFSVIILIVMVFTLGILWLIRENPYTLLIKEGGVLYSMDPDRTIQCVQDSGEVVEYPTPVKAYNAFELYWKPILFISVVNLIILIVFSLFYSHSMAGPIYNIKRTLREMIQTGEVKKIKVRKTDQFQDLVEVINEYIESVNSKK